MSKRINIVLSETTIQAIDRMAKPGQRSRFINEAVQHFISHCGAEALRSRLERTTVRDQDLDREIAGDWFAVDQQAWPIVDTLESKRRAGPSAAKSTSRRLTRH